MGPFALYFSHKLKGGTALQEFRLSGDTGKYTESIQHLESALKEWEQIVVITSRYFDDMSLTHLHKK